MPVDKELEVLYITRKHPPSVGGMQRLSFELRQSLAEILPLYVIAWGYSQKWLPFFMVYAVGRAVGYLIAHPFLKVILIGDPVLAPLAVALKLLFRKPILVVIHGLDVTYPNRFYQTVILGCLKRLDGFICISQDTRREAVRRGLPDRLCTVIPVGIDPHRFNPSQPLPPEVLTQWPSQFLRDSRIILLTVGRLVKRKGVAWFIEYVFAPLVAEYPQVHYLIVGNGPHRAEIEAFMHRLQLQDNITLCGQVSEPVLRAIYRRADIFVMPNIPIAGDMEGFGIVALEAAVSQTCVVAAKLEGIEDAVIDQENGWLVPGGDAEGFLKVLKLLITDGDLRQKFAEYARQFTLTRYDWRLIAQRYAEVMVKVAESYVI
jgi:phosphatidylinositol alpha-1,6-mannosyltransferase